MDAAHFLLAVEITGAESTVPDRFTEPPALYAKARIRYLWRLDLEPW